MALRKVLGVVLLLTYAQCAWCVETARLPASVCNAPFALFADGFEGATAIQRDASLGSGGAFPGPQTRVINVPGVGNKTYYLHIPAGYTLAQPLPLLLVLHGAAGNPAAAQTAAQTTRAQWGVVGDSGGFIVAAPIASGAQGGWVPAPGPSDYDVFAAVIADVEARYNVDRTRRHAWGFSAGGHVLHDVMLGPYFPALTADAFAGYAVAAGALDAFACSGASEAECVELLSSASRKIPLSLQVGTGDSLRPYVQADRARFLANGWVAEDTLRYVEFSGGHNYTQVQLAQTWDYLCLFQRLP